MAYKERNTAFGFTENRTLQTENYFIKTSFPLSPPRHSGECRNPDFDLDLLLKLEN